MSSALEAYHEKMGEFEKARREVEKVRKEAIGELLSQRKEINAQLRQLGYEGEGQDTPARVPAIALVADQPNGSPDSLASRTATFETILDNGHKRRRFRGSRTFDEAYCTICQLNGHDLRAHRGQAQKRAFSASELRAKGLAAESR